MPKIDPITLALRTANLEAKKAASLRRKAAAEGKTLSDEQRRAYVALLTTVAELDVFDVPVEASNG